MRGLGACACALILALAGCGGDGTRGVGIGDGPAPEPAPVEVVRAWADAVRAEDYRAATDLFALPAIVANNTPRATLTERAEIEAFNRSLPCGAIVRDSNEVNGGYLSVTFELTEGRGCGPGTGGQAEVTFKIVDGRIKEWLREADAPPPGSTEV